MKKNFTVIAMFALLLGISEIRAQVVLGDYEFNASGAVSSTDFSLFSKSSTDTVYQGRTQFRMVLPFSYVTGNMGLLYSMVDKYNPYKKDFLGDAIHTVKTFTTQADKIVSSKCRFKMQGIDITNEKGYDFTFGIIGTIGSDSIFASVNTMTTRPSEVMTYVRTKSGFESSAFHPMPYVFPQTVGSIFDYHEADIDFAQNEGTITFVIDGTILGAVYIGNLINTQFSVYLVTYVPGPEFPEAYDANLQPAQTKETNVTYTTSIDWLTVSSRDDIATINEDVNSEKMNIYPNPARDIVHLSLPGDYTVNVQNIQGETVLNKRISGYFSVSRWPKGLYTVRVDNNKIFKLTVLK